MIQVNHVYRFHFKYLPVVKKLPTSPTTTPNNTIVITTCLINGSGATNVNNEAINRPLQA